MSNIQLANQYKNKGNEAFKAQKYPEAVEFFSKAIENNPADHVFYSNRSGAYLNNKQYKQALDDAQNCIKINPTWPRGFQRKGTALFYLDQVQEAIQTYEDGLKLDPNNAELKKSLNDAKGQNSQQEQFNPAMLQAYIKLFNHPQTKDILQDPTFMPVLQQIMANPQLAVAMMDKDPRIKKIMEVLQSQTQPDEVEKIKKMFQKQNLGKKQEKSQQKPTPAPQAPRQESKPEPKKQTPPKHEKMQAEDPAEQIKNKGNQSFKKKNFNEALNYYEEAIKINPNEPLYYNNKAAVYIETKQYDLALEQIKRAEELFQQGVVKDFGKKAKVLARKGTIYAKTEHYDEAIFAFQKSLVEDMNSKVKDQLHRIKKLKKQKEAKQYINPELAEKHNQQGTNFYKEGKFPLALKQYEQAVRRNPEVAKYYSNIGQAYIKLMEFQRAKQHYEIALKKDPNFQKCYHKKGDCHFFLKQYHKALEVYEQGLKRDENDENCKQGIQKTQMAIYSGNSDEDQKMRAQRAMADPEIQAILSTPEVRNALADLERDPKALPNILKNKSLAEKLEKLIAAGVIRMG